MPRGVLVDTTADVAQEYYAGVVWDGIRKQPVMIFSDMGGIDIEEVAEEPPRPRRARALLEHPARSPDFQAKEVIASVGVTGRALNARHADPHQAGPAVRRQRHDARRDQPARRARGRLVRRRSTRTWTWRTRPRPRQKELLDGARRRRRGDAPGARGDGVRARRRGGRRPGPPRRRRQRHRVRRRPRPRHRRRRRLADALRRGPQARRQARQLLRDRRQPVRRARRAGLAKLVLSRSRASTRSR